jgi:hypothetical protein
MSAVLPRAAEAEAPRENADMTVDRMASAVGSPSPADRLAASRQRLRDALMVIAHPPPKPSLLDGLGMGPLKDQIMERLRSLPGAVLVLETIERWWAEHPLHTAGAVAGDASRRFVTPLAQKNPVGLLLGAAAVGALFVVSRPWRWLLRPALFVGLIPQLAAQAMKRMPLDSWMSLFSAAARGKTSSGNTASATRPSRAGTPASDPGQVPRPASTPPTATRPAAEVAQAS